MLESVRGGKSCILIATTYHHAEGHGSQPVPGIWRHAFIHYYLQLEFGRSAVRSGDKETYAIRTGSQGLVVYITTEHAANTRQTECSSVGMSICFCVSAIVRAQVHSYTWPAMLELAPKQIAQSRLLVSGQLIRRGSYCRRLLLHIDGLQLELGLHLLSRYRTHGAR